MLIKRLAVILFLMSAPLLAQDETIRPNGTDSVTGSACTTGNAHTNLDDVVDTEDDGECQPSTCSGSSRTENDIRLDFATPSSNPSTGTDDQLIRGRASTCSGDGGNASAELKAQCTTTDLDIGWTSQTLTGITEHIWTESFTFNTTDCSSDGSDLQVFLECTPSTGNPATRRSCTWDSVEMEITYSSVSRGAIITWLYDEYSGGEVVEILTPLSSDDMTTLVYTLPRLADSRLFGYGYDEQIRDWLRGGEMIDHPFLTVVYLWD